MAADNKSLGRFNLDGIPPAPRGLPQVEVTFDVDSNGILTVKAKDKTSGKEQSIRIEGSTGLSQADIDTMKADADAHAADDAKRKGLVETKNIADQMVYTAEKALKDNGDKVGDDIKKEVEDKIGDLRKAREGDDEAAIKTASEALSAAMQKIGEAMAKAQPQGEPGTPPPPDTGPTDAEFTEKPPQS